MQVIRSKIKSASIVMAIGVGGGGGNAVNHIYAYGERNISYLLFNTDNQALRNSNIPEKYKVRLGINGLGAGNDAQNGRQMALDSSEKIREILKESGVRMVFVIAGMGGGTGTGAAPVVSEIAKSMGILTVGVVTIPFESEGRHRLEQAIAGIDAMSKAVDSLIIINNSHIVEMYGNLSLSDAFFRSNELVSMAVKSISYIITKNFEVNVDFADVCRVMRDSGVALMGTGKASGNNRAIEATKRALTSPLLHMQDIAGAENVLVCMTSSRNPEFEVRMSDVRNIPGYIQQLAKTGNQTGIIWGAGYDDTLGEDLQVIVIATGFNFHNIPSLEALYKSTFETKKPESRIIVQPSSSKQTSQSIQQSIPQSRVVNAVSASTQPRATDHASMPDVKPQQRSVKPVADRPALEPQQISARSFRHSIDKSEGSRTEYSHDSRTEYSHKSCEKSRSESRREIFYDIADSKPAFLRRNVKLGVQDNSQQQVRRHVQKLETEEIKSSAQVSPSLFDDL